MSTGVSVPSSDFLLAKKKLKNRRLGINSPHYSCSVSARLLRVYFFPSFKDVSLLNTRDSARVLKSVKHDFTFLFLFLASILLRELEEKLTLYPSKFYNLLRMRRSCVLVPLFEVTCCGDFETEVFHSAHA